MHDLPPGVRAGIVPGKTYEYLAAGAPILAAIPDGDARDFLADAGNAYLCRPTGVEAMVDAISTEVDHRRAGVAPRRPDPEVVRRFERRRLTAQLAELFDLVLARPSADVSAVAASS
jgi:glycosyltransferase involved in cell wall biosynthesis